MSDMSDISLKCLITHTGDEKYIIAEVTEATSKSKSSWLVSHPMTYHSHIVSWFKAYLAESDEGTVSFSVKVCGGGIITIDHNKKHIKTYGQSGGYGKPNKEIVEQILKHNFPDYNLEVTVTSYIRD